MLNPELQKDINIEIEKSNDNIKSFLNDKYFRDTFDLIIKVNKLNPEQAEAVELETILNILGISDYANIEESIKNESGIENEQARNQVLKDLQEYLYAKLTPEIKEIKIESKNQDVKPLRNIIQDAYGKEMLGPVALDYYEDKRQNVNKENIDKDADTVLLDVGSNSNITADNISNEKENVTPKIVSDNVMHDVYRELLTEEDIKSAELTEKN